MSTATTPAAVVNAVILSGAISRRSDIRYSPKGKAILNITMAGETDGKSWFFPVTLFGKNAETYSEAPLGTTIKGTLSMFSFNDADGKKRSRTEVNLFGIARRTRDANERKIVLRRTECRE